MQSSIQFVGKQRKMLLQYYRSHEQPEIRLRAHIVLLLADGYSWAMITAVLFCSTRTVARWKSRFEKGGVHALVSQRLGPRVVDGQHWRGVVGGRGVGSGDRTAARCGVGGVPPGGRVS